MNISKESLLCLTVYCGDILFCWRSVFIQATTVLYAIGISMTRGFQKNVGPSALLSVCPSVCNANKKTYSSFIIDSRKIICISGERVWHPLQENKLYFQKIYILLKSSTEFSKKMRFCSLLLLYWRWNDILRMKGIGVLYKKIKCYSRKNRISKNVDWIFEKKFNVLLTHSSLLMVK